MKFLHIAFAAVVILLPAVAGYAPATARSDQESGTEAASTYVNSTPEAYAAMQKLPEDQPIFMLNLIRFRDAAEYKEGSEFAGKDWTGEQAYAEYSRISGPIAERFGAKVVFAGLPQLMLIGPQNENWDVAFIVAYPDLKSFLSFVSEPQYRAHAFHRSAAVADSRLVRMAALPSPE